RPYNPGNRHEQRHPRLARIPRAPCRRSGAAGAGESHRLARIDGGCGGQCFDLAAPPFLLPLKLAGADEPPVAPFLVCLASGTQRHTGGGPEEQTVFSPAEQDDVVPPDFISAKALPVVPANIANASAKVAIRPDSMSSSVRSPP